MSSVEYLREFVSERLTAAAEEIFRVFKQTVIEYEEEIDRQRKLLDIVWKPDVNLYRIELPQQHICKEEEEVLADQQLCDQERNSNLDQEEPEPPQIKEEEEDELCTSQDGEQLELKQETDAFMLIPPYEESDYGGDDQTLNLSIDETRRAAEKPLNYVSFKSFVVSEPNSDHQLLSHNSQVADCTLMVTPTHEESDHSESEPKCDQLLANNSHVTESHDRRGDPTMSKINCSTYTGEKSFKCDTCGKNFKYKSSLQTHLRSHTDEKPYSCSTCGKGFVKISQLDTHVRIHTGEKPYSCKTCGKSFRLSSCLSVHMRIHTGEKPYLCTTCGRGFRLNTSLLVHMRTHTGEKPFTCKICGKDFRRSDTLSDHMKIHTGEKPYLCKACGRDFSRSTELLVHMRIHTGEKPYLCKICGRDFRTSSALSAHRRRAHAGQRPYLCMVCGMTYATASHLAVHARSHTGK